LTAVVYRSRYDKSLSAADISYFKANGFVVKRGLLDPAKLAFARSQVWDAIEGKMPVVPGCPEQHMHLATPGVSRDDPATWAGAHCNHPEHGGGLRSLGHLPWMLDLVPNDPNVRAIAERMLGDLRPSLRTRGVYTIFPSAERKSKPLSGSSLGPHNDSVCQVPKTIHGVLLDLPSAILDCVCTYLPDFERHVLPRGLRAEMWRFHAVARQPYIDVPRV
jgi:hypothetical protein